MPGQIIYFAHDSHHRDILAPDLTSWLDGLVTSFEQGGWLEEDEMFVYEDEANIDVMTTLVPGYPIRRNAREPLDSAAREKS